MARFAINRHIFPAFLRSESTGGILLLVCVMISLSIANSSAGPAFDNLLKTPYPVFGGEKGLHLDLLSFINDALMAVFFLMVGLEIKRELVEGELSTPKQALLPIVAAIGGMVFPALIYTVFNLHEATGSGWGIPMATDIAFAIAILAVAGKRVPTAVKVFLVGLAIVDDLGAIIVIAVFYTAELHFIYLVYAAVLVALMVLLNRFGVKRIIAYLIPGAVLWYCIHHSGIHATIAGVLTALTIPTNTGSNLSPLEKLEKALHKPVNFLIMPLFALANTNIVFHASMFGDLTSPMALGIMAGLFFGKPLGITLFSWLSIKTGIAKMPQRSGWLHMLGAGWLGGIGFTMSIFISLLSFSDPAHTEEAKLAILLASVSAGVFGFFLFKIAAAKQSAVSDQ
ncbi:MAG: Na+/H+ antiporter NhaA [Mucilaginibacter polytrichastri]|nr:Na+/H+ antiporter NhaA [Mucilaginibacter polytrichastri]